MHNCYLNFDIKNNKLYFINEELLIKFINLIKNVKWVDVLDEDKYGNIIVINKIPYLDIPNNYTNYQYHTKITPTFYDLVDIDHVGYQIENGLIIDPFENCYDNDYNEDMECYYDTDTDNED
jgi:hypothetical protein